MGDTVFIDDKTDGSALNPYRPSRWLREEQCRKGRTDRAANMAAIYSSPYLLLLIMILLLYQDTVVL